MTKDEIIKALRDMARYPTVTLPRDSEALKVAADLLAQLEQEPVEKKKHEPTIDLGKYAGTYGGYIKEQK